MGRLTGLTKNNCFSSSCYNINTAIYQTPAGNCGGYRDTKQAQRCSVKSTNKSCLTKAIRIFIIQYKSKLPDNETLSASVALLTLSRVLISRNKDQAHLASDFSDIKMSENIILPRKTHMGYYRPAYMYAPPSRPASFDMN